MHFFTEDDVLLKKCNTIWGKVISDIKKECDSEIVYNKKVFKTEIKSYSDKATDFCYKKLLRWTLIILL